MTHKTNCKNVINTTVFFTFELISHIYFLPVEGKQTNKQINKQKQKPQRTFPNPLIDHPCYLLLFIKSELELETLVENLNFLT